MNKLAYYQGYMRKEAFTNNAVMGLSPTSYMLAGGAAKLTGNKMPSNVRMSLSPTQYALMTGVQKLKGKPNKNQSRQATAGAGALANKVTSKRDQGYIDKKAAFKGLSKLISGLRKSKPSIQKSLETTVKMRKKAPPTRFPGGVGPDILLKAPRPAAAAQPLTVNVTKPNFSQMLGNMGGNAAESYLKRLRAG